MHFVKFSTLNVWEIGNLKGTKQFQSFDILCNLCVCFPAELVEKIKTTLMISQGRLGEGVTSVQHEGEKKRCEKGCNEGLFFSGVRQKGLGIR